MPEPIVLSDEILLDAQRTAAASERTLSGQIEFWAHLGRAIEPLLDASQSAAMQSAGGVRPLSHCLATVDTEAGRQRLAAYLTSRPFPHYEPADEPDVLVRIEADGTRVRGRFIGRDFRASG